MTALVDMAYVTTKEDNVWRECAGCGVLSAMPAEVDRCERCSAALPAGTARRQPRRGAVRLTGRDLAVFGWLGQMKAVYEDDLPALMAGMPGTAWTSAGRKPSAPTVRGLLARWQRAGYVDARRIATGVPRVVRLTRTGAALVGVDGFRETSLTTAFHQCEVARLRLYLEDRTSGDLGRLVRWESERFFRADLDALGLNRSGRNGTRERVHVPDGVATYERCDQVAIEVERSVKAPVRLARIVEQLLTTYPVTLYAVTSNEIRNAVAAANKTARDALARRQLSAGRVGALTVIDMPKEIESKEVA